MAFKLTCLTALALSVLPVVPAAAQDGPTQPLAAELVELLSKQKLDAAATRLGENRYAAVLYIPGVQILAVSAEYAAPALLDEKIMNRSYRDVYLDLASASVPETKVFIEDMNADGIRPDRSGDNPFDMYTYGTGPTYTFDGEYKSRNVTESAYRKAFADAEAAYQQILSALIAELKKTS